MQRQDQATVEVTGVGSMPGVDPAEAARIVAGELTVPHVVELPDRGPGADMLGRTLSLLAAETGEFAAQTTPVGWRLAGGRSGADPGRQMRRGAAWLGEDLDRMEQTLAGYAGPAKVQVTGPWTLAAEVESVRGHRLLADRGGCAELAEALAEAVAAHTRAVLRRIPGAQLVVQVDEPALVSVLGGRVPTASGRGAVRAPGTVEAQAVLSTVVQAAQSAGAQLTTVHCCAPGAPLELLRRAGFAGVSLDVTSAATAQDEALGTWWESGGLVVLGVVGGVDPGPTTAESAARTVNALWGRIGFGIADVGARTWLSPTCGLAGATPAWSRAVGGLLRRAAGMLDAGT